MMQKIAATTSFTKDTGHISTRASIDEKGIIILSCYFVKKGDWGRGKVTNLIFNNFDFPFCFPGAKLNVEMKSE